MIFNNPLSITLNNINFTSDIIDIYDLKTRTLFLTAIGFTGTMEIPVEILKIKQFFSEHTEWQYIDISATNQNSQTITQNTTGIEIHFPSIAKIQLECTGIIATNEIKIDLAW